MSAFHKTAVLIDGLNLHYTAKALCFDIDFKRLLAEWSEMTITRFSRMLGIARSDPYRLAELQRLHGLHRRRSFKRDIGIEPSVDTIENRKAYRSNRSVFRR